MKFVVVAFLLTACTNMCSKNHENMSAEEALQAYLNTAFNFDEEKDKETLLEYTTDELKQAIAGTDTATLEEAYIQKKFELQKFYLISRNDLTPKEAELTFRLVYFERDIPDSAKVTAENTVFMIKEGGKWRIARVIGNKSAFDFPLHGSSQIKANAEEEKK